MLCVQIDALYTSKTAALQHALLNNVLAVANGTRSPGGPFRALNRAREVLGDNFLKGSLSGAGAGSGSNSEHKEPPSDADDGELSGEDDDADREESPPLTADEEAAIAEAIGRMTDVGAMAAMNKKAKRLLWDYLDGRVRRKQLGSNVARCVSFRTLLPCVALQTCVNISHVAEGMAPLSAFKGPTQGVSPAWNRD